VLLDTGVIVALFDRDEKFHEARAKSVLLSASQSSRHPRGCAGNRRDRTIPDFPFNSKRARQKSNARLRKYRDRKIDLPDSRLICLADEFETAEILTLDRDFTIYRWGRNKLFHKSHKPRLKA
jgi:predicted nucleic acid-binding protein